MIDIQNRTYDLEALVLTPWPLMMASPLLGPPPNQPIKHLFVSETECRDTVPKSPMWWWWCTVKNGCAGNTPTKVFLLHWCYRYTLGCTIDQWGVTVTTPLISGVLQKHPSDKWGVTETPL